ncbi:hypothetical protein BJQ94_18350 [Cryobacterium sp. SO2]|uniref:hypothetical protein n=1 Tax=Cryobacterium sp. SO2 TaxID=1897060 RepID=UPI00223E4396|nr:hypothetical protein [Cryobacterium sp. SO2]WEO77285.1 hypothetical protein BJQ94_18350 [Cryobacterium sp. SO2]
MEDRLPIFDIEDRTEHSPATHEETSFAFLNRVGGEFWENPRRLLQEWANRLPVDAYADIRGRLRESNDQAQSAFLELYIHESLLRAGFSVTVHPDIPESNRHPDFLATRGSERFYVEAVMPQSRPDGGSANRLARFLDGVNKLDDSRFFLDLQDVVVGARSVGAGDLRRRLKKWLDELDPDAPADSDRYPTFPWTSGDWSARFGAIAKSPQHRRSSRGRAIGVYSHGDAEFIDDAGLIRRGATLKARAYGELDAPFVIAVGVYLFDDDLEDAIAAMFGHEAWIITASGTASRSTRMADGFFGTRQAAQHIGTSAVLVVNQLQPHHVPRSEVTLIHHPWATRPLEVTRPFHAVELRLNGAQLQRDEPFESAARFFGIEAWADLDPWPKA